MANITCTISIAHSSTNHCPTNNGTYTNTDTETNPESNT
jgi:hypothetical protein